jgi:hypothetical protein
MGALMPSAPPKSDRVNPKSITINRHKVTRSRIGLWLLISLGYAYILAICVIILGLIYSVYRFFAVTAPILGTTLCWISIVAIGITIYNFLQIEIGLPPGVTIDLHAPSNLEFKNLLTSLSQNLKSPSIDRVIIDRQLDMSIIQTSRFGNKQRYLKIGLPLLMALSPEQFQANLACELAYLSITEKIANNWIYSLGRKHQDLISQTKNSITLSLIYISFLCWYVPLLESYTLAMSRKYRYEVDRLVAGIVGSQNLAEALIAIELNRQLLERQFWPEVFKNERNLDLPPLDIFSQMESALAERDLSETSQWLQAALERDPDERDSHPCLRDRLLALGYTEQTISELSLNSALQLNAARKYLNKSLPNLVNRLGKDWQTEVSNQWQQKFNQRQKAEQSIERLTAKVEQSVSKTGDRDLTIDELVIFADRKIQLGDLDGSLIILHQSLEINPSHAHTNLLLGTVLLKMGNARGIDYLETAMNIDLGLTCEATSTIRQFSKTVANTEVAELYAAIATKYYLEWTSNSHKYAKLKPRDLHRQHRLSELSIEEVTANLIKIPEIQHMYATLKSSQDDLLEHHYLFATYKLDRAQLIDDEDLSKLYIDLERAVEPLGLCTIFQFEQYGYYECDPLIDNLRSIPKTCIYNRKKILALVDAKS